MPETKNQELTAGETSTAYGSIKIADEAVASIVSLEVAQIKGVAAMSGSMAVELTEKLGKKTLSKGVKVELDGQNVLVALNIFVEYGVKIPKLALEIQNRVRDTIQTMTGLKVKEVNIYVQGISFERVTEPVEDTNEEPAAILPEEETEKTEV